MRQSHYGICEFKLLLGHWNRTEMSIYWRNCRCSDENFVNITFLFQWMHSTRRGAVDIISCGVKYNIFINQQNLEWNIQQWAFENHRNQFIYNVLATKLMHQNDVATPQYCHYDMTTTASQFCFDVISQQYYVIGTALSPFVHRLHVVMNNIIS